MERRATPALPPPASIVCGDVVPDPEPFAAGGVPGDVASVDKTDFETVPVRVCTVMRLRGDEGDVLVFDDVSDSRPITSAT